MARGKLYLDIDGPLNPYNGTNKPRLRAGYRKHHITPDDWYDYRPLSVWLNQRHGAALLELAEAIDFELFWATTWNDQANVWIAGKIGLPKLPVVTVSALADGWKFQPVLEHAGSAPIAWLDDFDNDPEWGVGHPVFAKYRADFLAARRDAPTLLHTVSPRYGLTDIDLTAVRDWATAL